VVVNPDSGRHFVSALKEQAMSRESDAGRSRPAFRTLRLALLSIAALLFSISAAIQWVEGQNARAMFVSALAVGMAAQIVMLLGSARS
jgi:hypothetical protein